MTRDELMERLQAAEDTFVERKVEAVTPADIRKTVCAFANTAEGREAILFKFTAYAKNTAGRR